MFTSYFISSIRYFGFLRMGSDIFLIKFIPNSLYKVFAVNDVFFPFLIIIYCYLPTFPMSCLYLDFFLITSACVAISEFTFQLCLRLSPPSSNFQLRHTHTPTYKHPSPAIKICIQHTFSF